MSANTRLADQYADIAQRLREIEAEKMKAISESKLPEVEEVPSGFGRQTFHEDDLWS